MEMGDRDLAETLLNQAPEIKTDLCDSWDYKILAETTIEFQADINKAVDAYEPASAIYEMAIAKAENMDQWSWVAQQQPIPLAMGERLYTIYQFRDLLNHHGAAFVRPDLSLAGGITNVKKIAAIAESAYAGVVPHTTSACPRPSARPPYC